MLYHAKEAAVDIHGSRMDYAVFGNGQRPMLLIPGLSLRSVRGTAGPLAVMYRLFAEDYRVWVFDRRENVPEGVAIEDLAGDVAEAARQLHIENADVLGISQGGMIAQVLAIRHPALVRRLTLGVTLCRPNATVQAAIDGWVRSAERGDYEAIVRDMMQRMYSERYVRRYQWLFPLMLRTAEKNPPERFIRLAKSCLTCDIYDELDKIRCPVLVLGGREDKVVTPQASEEIAERLGCPIHMYEGLGHSAYEEAKDFNRRVYDFFSAPTGEV